MRDVLSCCKSYSLVFILIAIAILLTIQGCSSDSSKAPQAKSTLPNQDKNESKASDAQNFELKKPKVGDVQIFNGIEFVYIPPGTFMMGSDSGDDDEKPVHKVTITKGFWMSKYEVTQAQWESVMDKNPSNFSGANRPVENISWNSVNDFLLSKMSLSGPCATISPP